MMWSGSEFEDVTIANFMGLKALLKCLMKVVFLNDDNVVNRNMG